MKTMIALILAFTLTGCASNPYKEFYTDQTGGAKLEQLPVVLPTGEPRLVEGTDPTVNGSEMLENGYALLGYSSFVGPLEDQSQALKLAKALQADTVIVYSKFQNTVSGSMPITTPTSQTTYSSGQATAYGSNGGYATAYGSGQSTTHGSQTSYVPFSVDRYNQGAQFWIRKKMPIFGANVGDLSEAKRQETGSNKGVEIAVVIKGTPAFNADIMRGDVIRKIDGRDISVVQDYMSVLQGAAGKSVAIELVRNGKSIKKTVQLNQEAH